MIGHMIKSPKQLDAITTLPFRSSSAIWWRLLVRYLIPQSHHHLRFEENILHEPSTTKQTPWATWKAWTIRRFVRSSEPVEQAKFGHTPATNTN